MTESSQNDAKYLGIRLLTGSIRPKHLGQHPLCDLYHFSFDLKPALLADTLTPAALGEADTGGVTSC
jgi:hypothetical protein